MNKLRNQLMLTTTCAFVAGVILSMADSVAVCAAERNTEHEFPCSGIAAELNFNYSEKEEAVEPKTEEKLNIHEKFDKEQERMLSELTMANISNTLNVRSEASEESSRIGYMYRDCGGTILERKDGWTRIQSGALTGWCSDEYLVFGDEAVDMAEEVGQWMVTIDSEAVRVHSEPYADADVRTIMSKSDIADFLEIVDDYWISIDFDGEVGYIKAEFANITFHIDQGETMEQVKTRATIEERIRKEAERKAIVDAITANRTQNRGAVAPRDADEVSLLAALIYCEAGNQSYEGMVGVGAVVMNRVKSPAYPNTIYSVIYASGQFTPAMSGKVARVYQSGAPEMCYQAAIAALNGETTVGGATHFRRNNGRPGYVLGDHVFW